MSPEHLGPSKPNDVVRTGGRWVLGPASFTFRRCSVMKLYLTRYVLFRTPWFGIYVHQIHAHGDRHPHNHPRQFWSLVLRGHGMWSRSSTVTIPSKTAHGSTVPGHSIGCA